MGIRLGRSQLRYCAKVGMASGLGYLLTQGNRYEYAIYSAFAAARVGVTVSVITLVAHHSNPVQYDLLRQLNTLIGVGVGLAVSFADAASIHELRQPINTTSSHG